MTSRKKAAVLLDFVQITFTPPTIWTTCTTFFERKKRRFKRHSKWLIIQNSSYIKQMNFPKSSFMTPDTLQYVISSNLSVLLFGLCQLLGELLESWKRLRGFLNTQDTTYYINHSYFIYYICQREVERFIKHIAHWGFRKIPCTW